MATSQTKSKDKKPLTKIEKTGKTKLPEGDVLTPEQAEGRGGTFIPDGKGNMIRLYS